MTNYAGAYTCLHPYPAAAEYRPRATDPYPDTCGGGRGELLVLGRCRGCGGRSSSRRIRFKGVSRRRTSSITTYATIVMVMRSKPITAFKELAGYAYGHTLSSPYSSTGSVGYSPGYGASWSGVAMKREEDETGVCLACV